LSLDRENNTFRSTKTRWDYFGWKEGSRQLPVGSCQSAVGSCKSPVDSRQWAVNTNFKTCNQT